MKSENLRYESGTILKKTRSSITVVLEDGRKEKRPFFGESQQELVNSLKVGEQAIAVLNTMNHDSHLSRIGVVSDHIEKILVPGDSNYEEALSHISN